MHLRILLAFAAASLLLAASCAAEGYSFTTVWDYDSISGTENDVSTEGRAAKSVCATLVQMNEFWNVHDLENYLERFWKSPALVFVDDGAVYSGWQELHDRYIRGFADRNGMGRGTISRVQIRILEDDTALALEHWTLAYPGSNHATVGVDTLNLKRFDGLWKVTLSHSSYLEM